MNVFIFSFNSISMDFFIEVKEKRKCVRKHTFFNLILKNVKKKKKYKERKNDKKKCT